MSDHAAREAISRMNLRPMAIAPHYSALAADLRLMASMKPADGHAAFLARREELCAAYGLPPVSQNKSFAFSNGVAIIPVTGTLINRFSYSYGSVTGYNFIRSQVAAAGMDADVKAILYDFNTYGGEAAGCFECARDMRVLANGKPTMAMIDSNCYSAGMALASAADKIVSTPSGGAGSIGVVAMHVDMSKMLEDFGVTITFIHAGDHKVDGNPFEPLPKEVKADMQKNVNASYDAFVALIADHRGMDAKAVRDTQARTYRAEDALALGLIDAIESPSVAVHAFLGELSGSTLQLQQEPQMANEQDNKPGAAADQAAALETATKTASAEATKAERARISGIQGCEEAKGREALASHLALSTDLSVDAAKGILAATPKAEPAKPAAAANPFKQAMDADTHPNVGATAGNGGDEGNSDVAATNMLLSSYSAATGRPLKLVGQK